MRSNNVAKRLLSVFLVLCMVCAWVLPASAHESGISVTQVSNDRVSANLFGKDPVHLEEEKPRYADDEIVRVSIFVDRVGVIDAGYEVTGLATNKAAMAYREKLQDQQLSLITKIEKATSEKLDVVWQLTLATNLISANVKFGQIAAIEKIAGVRKVVIETPYEPDVVSSGAADPNMATSGKQTGSTLAWTAGYTGAGSRVAIIDTGLDTEHLSFDAAAYEYSLSLRAEQLGMSYEEYVASLDLLDAEEIALVVDQLHVSINADEVYINSKIPFGFNYIDKNYDVTHLNDKQGEHGSHVAGIATANAYVPVGEGEFASALEEVYVQGVAPDAQVIVMKVFGAGGGAYPADYMAAIEDAILLGADSINLSLGSGNPGMSKDSTDAYNDIFNSLEKSGVVVSISAGNAGAWMDSAENGVPFLYLDDVSMQTNGSPGSYTNSLSVASVDNAGFVAAYVSIGGENIYYTEALAANDGTPYSNAPIATLAGTQEFVFLNNIGTEEQFAALGEGVLKGKIALCYRGENSFHEKAEAAVKNGAIGVIIVNNQDGFIRMDLSKYSYTAPVVSITQAEGEKFKLNAVMDETTGDPLYWTGTMEVSAGAEVSMYPDEYYTMSDFSSWGVPGSLELKPEITAPGGDILSVGGAFYYNEEYGVIFGDHASYEVMGGTSMAAPQVAGMAALLAQYIRENDLEAKTGLDARTLAQSLLMSTAVPVLEGDNGGYYYSVLKQGAGLANVGAAIMADSYILMGKDATASYADGKVKVELGDDPAKEGVYTFSFTINNLTNTEKVYALSADFFTQGAFPYNNTLYLDTWTTPLNPIVAFVAEGQELKDMDPALDFNGDKVVDFVDGYYLLECILSGAEISAAADLDGNEVVTSYDAFLFFEELGESTAVVPANGSVTVEVAIALSDSDREYLAYYENGAYLEGFVYAETVATEEGVMGTSHSIPVLGFYGNWSDASMFDKGSYEDYYLSKEETRAPYLLESNFMQRLMNGLFVTYANDPANAYYFGGNPLVPDDEYKPERNAISAANGDMISQIGFTAIRNAGASFFQVLDLTNQQVLANQPLGVVSSAYYYVNGGVWKQTYLTLNANLCPTLVEDNTVLDVGICLVPEYYVDAEGYVDWAALGNGTTFSMSMTVDNTAPVLNEEDVSIDESTLNIKVTDNQYIAAVVLLDQFGEHPYVVAGSQADAQPGVACEYALDLSEVNGAKFLLQVYDYAMNCTTYEISQQIGDVVDEVESMAISQSSLVMQKNNKAQLQAIVYPVNASDRSYTWASSNEAVATVDANGVVTAVAEGEAQIIATSVLDNTKTAVCNVEVIDIAIDMNAIVWDEEGSIWFSEFNTATLPEYVKVSGDMLETDYFVSAAMTPDGTLYAGSLDTQTGVGALYRINTETWEATKLSDCTELGIQHFYADLTYAPGIYGTGALMGVYGPYVITIDLATGAPIEVIDEFEGDNYLVGIANCYSEFGYGNTVYLVQSNGVVTQEIYLDAGLLVPGYEGMIVPYSLFLGERSSMETGISVGDALCFNSLYYDEENAMIFWSAFDEERDNNVTLYAIDEMNDFAVHNLGQFADGVWPVAGLYQSVIPAASEENALNLEEMKAAVEGKTIAPKHYEIQKIERETAPVLPMSGAILDTEKDTVTVAITAKDVNGEDVATTNGLITVNYDPAAQTLRNVIVHGDYYAVTQEEGAITFAYVKVDGFDPSDVVATLIFDVMDESSVNVAVEYKEINEGYDLNNEEEVQPSTLMQALEDLEAAIAAGDKALDEKIAALSTALQQAIADCQAGNTALSAQIASANATLRALVSQVSSDLAAAEQELSAAIAAGDKALDDKIAELNAALEAAIAVSDAAEEAMQAEIDEAVAALEAAIAAGDKALADKIAALEAAIAAANAANEELKAELNKNIADAVATLNAAIAQVQKNLDDAKAELNAKDDQLAAKDNELAAKDDQLAAQAAQLSKLVTVAIVIASIAACGCVALLVLNIIDKRKKA